MGWGAGHALFCLQTPMT